MNAKEISTKRFEKATFNGYKTDEVDDYLKEVSEEFSQIQKEKNELERKLEVLADKIREYRDDEEALKDALLIAQKHGNAIVAESKASAEKITTETKAAVEKLLSESKAKSEKMITEADAYSKRTREDADARAAKIVGDAQFKADEIKAAMDKQQTIQEDIIQRTRKEVHEYLEKLNACYTEHLMLIKSLPEKCESDFVKRTAAEVEKREAERKKQEAAQAKARQAKKPQPPKPQPEKPAPKPEEKSEQAEEPFQTVSQDNTPVDDKQDDNNLPFFNSPSEPVARHDRLKFGKNNKE